MRTNEDEGWRRRARLFGVERLNDLDRWRMRQAEQSEQRALPHAEEQRAQQQADAPVAASDEIATLRGELDGLRSDVVTGLRAVGVADRSERVGVAVGHRRLSRSVRKKLLKKPSQKPNKTRHFGRSI